MDQGRILAANYPLALPDSAGSPAWPLSRKAVGVVIPLSGKWESVGQKILKGIQTASGVFTSGPAQNVEYIIMDYGNNEGSIPSIIDELDRTHRVVAVIGPVGEQACEIACKELQARHLPAIMFTQAETAPMAGTNCFRNFLSVDLQAKALLNAARSMGITRFAIMSPDDRFGKTFADKFARMSQSFGITIIKAISYSQRNLDFKQELKTLFPGGRKTSTQLKALGSRSDIEAILVPDSAANAAMISSYVSYLNIRHVRLFGPTLWDTPELLKAGGRSLEDAVFLSGYYQGSILSAAQDFNRSFTDTFHQSPSVWEACSFDTAQILQVFTSSGNPSREALRNYLASLRNYHGVSGTTSFYPDGALEKSVYVLSIKDGLIYEIHP